MSFLQEKYSRRYAAFLSGFAGALLFAVLFLSWMHGKECQNLLYANEQAIVSSLIDQGVPIGKIAAAMKNSEVSEAGVEFLQQIGHTSVSSFRLFPAINHSVITFTGAAAGMMGILLIMLLWSSVHFLQTLENLYRTAADRIAQFSDGNFKNHLPGNENGALFQLFSAIEELAAALQSQRKQEQHVKEFLKNMISDISHQLKTPLAALTMYMEIMSEEPDNVETVQKFSEKSMQSLERINQLIQSMLKAARLDAGSIVFHKREQSVSALVFRAMENLTERAEMEGKQFIIKGDSSETLFCDPEWTGEAIGNLIKNALDHTSCKGTICICWKRSPGMFRLSVADDGCGIAQEDIHHIFKRFYRSKKSGSQSANSRQGVGLGLPLAKAIIEGQDGILSVNSTPGEGAVFTISFLTDS